MPTLLEKYPEMPSPCEDCPFKDYCDEQNETDTDKLGCWDRCAWLYYESDRRVLLHEP